MSIKPTPEPGPVLLPTKIQDRMAYARLPVQYTDACKAIAACRSLDEGHFWASKADALAAYAKIYQDDKAGIEARRLKLFAYRRMAELSEELRPTKRVGPKGARPGGRSLLVEHGFSKEVSKYIRRVGAIPPKKFDELVNRPRPPSISVAAEEGIGHSDFGTSRAHSTEAWRLLSTSSQVAGVNLRRFVRLFCRRFPARTLAQGLSPEEAANARELIHEASAWLADFQINLPARPIPTPAPPTETTRRTPRGKKPKVRKVRGAGVRTVAGSR